MKTIIIYLVILFAFNSSNSSSTNNSEHLVGRCTPQYVKKYTHTQQMFAFKK